MKLPKHFPIIYKVIIIVIFCLINLGVILSLDSGNATTDTKLQTPYETVYQHLRFLENDAYNPAKSAKAFKIKNVTQAEAIELAVKLKKIYDGLGLIVELDQIPNDANYTDSVSGLNKYVLFDKHPTIYVKKTGSKWLYSSETIENIPVLYEKIYPFEIAEYEEYFPDFLKEKFLGMKIWKYLAIVLYILAGIFLYYIFKWIFGFILIRIFSKTRYKDLVVKTIYSVSKPLSWLLVLFLALNTIPILNIPVQLNKILIAILYALLPVFITLILYKLVDLFTGILSKIAKKTATTVDDNLVPLARKIFKVIVVIFGALYLLKSLDIDITPFIAGVSVGGLAFALAAQDMVKNLFGSITIFTDKPFDVGDWIVFDGGEGTVTEVGVRSTRLLTFYNSIISIPNGKLADMTIDNMGKREYRRYSTNIAITYDTPPELIDAFVEGLKRIVALHPKTRKDFYQIHLNSFGDSSLNILFYIFFKVADWTEELEARHQVMNEVIRLANTLGVRFALPTQTLFIEEFPEKQSLTPNHIPDANKYKKDMSEFIKNREQNYKEE